LPSNYHNFSDGDQKFSIAKKSGMPHIFENFSMATSNQKNFIIILKLICRHRFGDDKYGHQTIFVDHFGHHKVW
jgi:hypothetical protein